MAVVGATVAVTAITLTVVAVPPLHFAYRSLLAHVAIESAAVVVAGLAAGLCVVRFRRTRALTDLLLFATLLLLSVTNLAFSLIPSLSGEAIGAVSTWGPVAGRFLGAIGFFAAAMAGQRTVRHRGATRWATQISLGTAIVIGLVVLALREQLPAAVDVEVADPADSGLPSLTGHPLILGLHLVSMALYAGAAWGFLRQSAQPEQRLKSWLAIVMVIGAGARLNYFLYPSLYSEYVYFGDLLRLAFYLTLLAAIIAEILGYERRLATVAVLEERRRFAREIHDGLAQELAFISARAKWLGDDGVAREIALAADRALRDARSAMSALMRPIDESLPAAMRRVATEAVRGEAAVEVTADIEHGVDPALHDTLLRIVGEAAGNAARHGGAQNIRLHVHQDGDLRVRIGDDGSGFDPQAGARPGCYGLIGMRERAEAMGGTLRIESAPGAGSEIEIVIP